jgi:hypothetical protein
LFGNSENTAAVQAESFEVAERSCWTVRLISQYLTQLKRSGMVKLLWPKMSIAASSVSLAPNVLRGGHFVVAEWSLDLFHRSTSS